MKIILERINYEDLNARQKEFYNFQKVSALLADYGYKTIKLSDDWQGADFIAQHFDGETYLKVQLKGRLTFDKKYIGRNIIICFRYNNEWYLCEHDKLLKKFLKKYQETMGNSRSWKEDGGYSWNTLSREKLALLRRYKL